MLDVFQSDLSRVFSWMSISPFVVLGLLHIHIDIYMFDWAPCRQSGDSTAGTVRSASELWIGEVSFPSQWFDGDVFET